MGGRMIKQILNMNGLSISLIIFGGISIIFSIYSSILAFIGVGILLIIIGGIMYVKNIKMKLSGKSISVIVVLLISIVILSSCGAIKVPMAPNVGKIKINEKLPVEAGLLITVETKNYIFKGNPESFTGSARSHEFPLGEALEKASSQAFLQVFQKLRLFRTFDEAKESVIIIEPKIEDFHFRYDQLSYAGFAIAVLSKIKVHVTLANGETKIWEKSIESPEQKKGPWFVNMSYEREVGESASDALVYVLKKIALEVAEDVSINKYISENPCVKLRWNQPD